MRTKQLMPKIHAPAHIETTKFAAPLRLDSFH